MAHILIAAPNDNLRHSVSHYLRNRKHSVVDADGWETALPRIDRDVFDIIIVDASIAGDGMPGLVGEITRRNPTAMVLVAFDLEQADVSVEAIQAGAFGVIQKPVRVEEIGLKVSQAIELKRLQHEAQSLRGERDLVYRTDSIIGESSAIRRVLDLVNRVAGSPSNILLAGETGTGKELIAGAIHYNSNRADGPFVRVNCAALPEQLLESELFGHEKGAYTGAEKLRIGRFEQADGGTIFLDEIADMSPATQAKVLRVLQEKEFERLGGNRTVKTDVRIIAATNKDLEKEIESGRFRQDLYYRLNVVTIRVPPLRERPSDILRLAEFFVRKFSAELKRRPPQIHPLAAKMLAEYDWPGNVRQLRNAIERAVIMTDGRIITPDELIIPANGHSPAGAEPVPASRAPYPRLNLQEAEKGLVIQALNLCGWVQKEAAGQLGISSRALNYKIRKYGITHPSWKRNR
jgi:DNA-binding NtrC family response regulator